MQIKSCPVRIKTVADSESAEAEGTFEAIVSAYNVDSYGEQVVPGAFKDTLADWAERGAPIPVLWSHRSDDPDYHIGSVLEAKETAEGLWVKAQIDLDGGGKGPQVHRLLKGRRVTQFSFAYDVVDAERVKGKADDGTPTDILQLRKLKLYEVGPTLIGVNQATELLGVKAAENLQALAAEAEDGRILSGKNQDALRTAYEAIGALLGSIKDSDDDGEAQADEPEEDLISPDPMRDAPVFSSSERLALEIEI